MSRGVINYGERAALNEDELPKRQGEHHTLTAPEERKLPQDRIGPIGGPEGARRAAFVWGWVPR